MANYWNIVNKAIEKADILLLILDSRFIQETRNEEIEQKIRSAGKTYLRNDKMRPGRKRLHRKNKTQTKTISIRLIKRVLRRNNTERKNTHRSKQARNKRKSKSRSARLPKRRKIITHKRDERKKAAPTSITSGQTRGVQNINAGSKIVFLDTPGVIPYQEKDKNKHALTGTTDFAKTKEPDLAVMHIMEQYPGKIERHYEVEVAEDKEQTLEQIALKKKSC